MNDNVNSFDTLKFDKKGVKIANNRVDIYKESKTGTKVTGNTFIKVVYKKSAAFDKGTGMTNVSKIVIDGVGTYTVKLIEDTGKHFVET